MHSLLRSALCTTALLLILTLPAMAATITLAWDFPLTEEANITSFQIHHSLDNQATWQQAATATPTARTVAYALTVSGTVCWRAFAVSGTASSEPSNVVCHVFPPAPTQLTVTITLSGVAQ